MRLLRSLRASSTVAGPLLMVGALGVAAARCGDGSGGGPSGNASAKPLPRCEVDLAPYLTGVTGASSAARSTARVAGESDLIGGEAASARAGDVLLANDRIRVLIEAPGRTIGSVPYGGNIIDADLATGAGATGNDRFGEIGALFQFGRTIATQHVDVVRDGSDGGPAIVAATGWDLPLDFVNLPGLVRNILPALASSIPSPDVEMRLRSTAYYILPPGSNAVRMVHAYCNDGTEDLSFAAGDLIDSGGQVELFGQTGFGSGASASGGFSGLLSGTPVGFVGWAGRDVSYGYIPSQAANQALTVAGVTATLVGAQNLLDWVGASGGPPPAGAVFVDAGKSAVVHRDFVVARTPSEVFDAYYVQRQTATAPVRGRVRRAGVGVGGVRVAAWSGSQVLSVFVTDGDGAFSGQVPAGSVSFQADDGTVRSATSTVSLQSGATADVPLDLATPGQLSVTVTDAASGGAVPAKVTIQCVGLCPSRRSGVEAQRFADVDKDATPVVAGNEVFDYLYLEPGQTGRRDVPAGDYVVWVSRGPEYSLDRQPISVRSGATTAVSSRIAALVDSKGWASADFHVHAINSPDSPIADAERVRTFLAEGVDVIVSTDHDFITDFAPAIDRMGVRPFLHPVIGEELTTFDYGHYNAFPLQRDSAQRNGGAVDWAGGDGPGMTPADIFESLDAFPGEQVVQINHPRGQGTFSALGLDTRTLWTRARPSWYRIRAVEPDRNTGDTRLFDSRFTAVELQNGFSEATFVTIANDWMALLSRGVRMTATAVSDTHMRHGDAGHPRTFVGLDVDAPERIDDAALARAVNAGRAFGTNGPFVRVTASAGGSTATLGDTLVTGGADVTLEVDVSMPDWMQAGRVDVYVNTSGTETGDDGKARTQLPPPQATVDLSEGTITHPVASLPSAGRRVQTARVTLPRAQLTKDAWIVVMVRGGSDLFPVVGKGNVPPLAFTNPIFVDIDGGGWTPPVDLAAERARVGSLGGTAQPLSTPVTEQELRRIFRAECRDDGHGH